MNRENVEFAIKLMGEAKCLSMSTFQSSSSGECSKSIEQLHACGNSACFIGYLALTEKFKTFVTAAFKLDKSSKIDFDGSLYERFTFTDSECEYRRVADSDLTLATFLGIEVDLAEQFIYGMSESRDGFYPVRLAEVEPEHVIEKLNQLLAGELE